MHRSHLPLLVWAQAIYLMVSSPKGVSSLKLSELLGLPYKTTWHLTQRIRLMLAADVEAGLQAGHGGRGPLLQGLVEIDEAYAGAPPRKRAAPHPAEDNNDRPLEDHDDRPPPSGGGPGGSDVSGTPKGPSNRKVGRGTSRPMPPVTVERAHTGHGADTHTNGTQATLADPVGGCR